MKEKKISEVEVLRKDVGTLFKWLSLRTKIDEMQGHKNYAIKQQNFEKAVIYRNEETKTFSELMEVNKELNDISEKYLK